MLLNDLIDMQISFIDPPVLNCLEGHPEGRSEGHLKGHPEGHLIAVDGSSSKVKTHVSRLVCSLPEKLNRSTCYLVHTQMNQYDLFSIFFTRFYMSGNNVRL